MTVAVDTGHFATATSGATAAASVLARDERIGFVDNARAIGILLVVIGHAPGLSELASDFIFAFHMPLFFFLSGLMVGSERLGMRMARRAALLARALLLPYLAYFIVSYVYWLLLKRHGLRAVEFEGLPWWDPIAGFIGGTAGGLYFNVVLWFFPCLFVVAVVHHAVCRFVSTRVAAGVAVLVAAGFIAFHNPQAARWWWSADCAVVGLAFYAIGAAVNPRLRHPQAVPSPGLCWTIGACGYAACLVLVGYTGHVDLNHLAFGRVGWLYLPLGAIGVVATLALAAALPRSGLSRWLSGNTLVIFPLHFLMFSVVTGVAIEMLGLPEDFKATMPGVLLLYVGAALLMSWPAAIVVATVRRRSRALWPRP